MRSNAWLLAMDTAFRPFNALSAMQQPSPLPSPFQRPSLAKLAAQSAEQLSLATVPLVAIGFGGDATCVCSGGP